MTKLTQPIKWHGGKHYLASKIVALMPAHMHYVEPYAGGLSVLLAKDPEGVSEVVNDIHGELINFWRVLATPIQFQQFESLCQGTPFSQWHYENADKIFDTIKGVHVGIEPASAYTFFVKCRQSLAGRMDSFAPLSRTRTRRGMNEQASAWWNAVEGLPDVHARLKRVVILNDDALKVIRAQDGPDTLFYCDPPYLHETRATTGEYEFEMSEADHCRLLRTIEDCQGNVMLSGYRSEMYDDWLKDWTRHEFDLPNNSAGGKSKMRRTECVWCNF